MVRCMCNFGDVWGNCGLGSVRLGFRSGFRVSTWVMVTDSGLGEVLGIGYLGLIRVCFGGEGGCSDGLNLGSVMVGNLEWIAVGWLMQLG